MGRDDIDINALLNRLELVEKEVAKIPQLQRTIDKQQIIINKLAKLNNVDIDLLEKDDIKSPSSSSVTIPIITTTNSPVVAATVVDSSTPPATPPNIVHVELNNNNNNNINNSLPSSTNSTPNLSSSYGISSPNLPPLSPSLSRSNSMNDKELTGVASNIPIPPPLPPPEKLKKFQPTAQWRKPFMALMGGSRLKREGSKDSMEVYLPPMSPKLRSSSNADQQQQEQENAAAAAVQLATSPDVTQSFILKHEMPPLPSGSQWAVVWEYDASAEEWTRGMIAIQLESRPFASGALRSAYKLTTKMNPTLYTQAFYRDQHSQYEEGKKLNLRKLPRLFGPVDSTYVAKLSKTTVSFERYFEDVKMQMMCREYGIRYTANSPPKPVDFLSAWVIEVQADKGDHKLYGLEMYIDGEFKKLNSNFGSVFGDRNTPQSFSHFSYEASAHELIIVDIQGVDDHYTDPQIHTKDGEGFGAGNLGEKGMKKFIESHKCNPICIQLELPPIGIDLNDSRNMTRVIRGTMMLPDLKPDLDPKLDITLSNIPQNPAQSELSCVSTLTGHSDRITSIVIDTDKRFVYSGSGDGTLKVWSLDSLQLIETIRAHRKSVTGICFNDSLLFTSSADQTIKIWDRSTYQSVGSPLDGHTGEINGVCIDGARNHLFSCSFDKSIRVWELVDGGRGGASCIKVMTAHSKSVKSICISGKYLFSASNDQSIKVWDLEMLVCIYGIGDAHDSWVTALGIHNESGILFSGCRDGGLKAWNLNTFMPSSEHDDNTDAIVDVLVTKNYIFTASEDSSVKIYLLPAEENDKLKNVLTLKAHRGSIYSIASDGSRIFTGASDNSIKVWTWKDK
ncbi:putative protein serine/threonine kinase [Cavenderia fasciculata]|uniref:Alpha-type protein kinase domain-containing protein n=1 Tax=Cavenderia fasciculata TaxID=261658 RepID=F4PQJ1_CACFS|nr:putative protein serine/threonine kinase [Cavenderia fasciculata]EGG22654.1 putative protein serine/threonine kinase [Cavenderia fasciculata]|eukprot:XP_004360505.1 putative protein serine/threonine kinase [Cavenderia fasciculata]